MKRKLLMLAATGAVVALGVSATAIGGSAPTSAPDGHAGMHVHSKARISASDLRVTLNRLLGEHVYLAVEATHAGLRGDKDFAELAKALDRNSVELSQAITLVFGKAAGNQFLNGKFLWRDHIRFFVDYTVGLAKGNKAMQTKAVNNLKIYIGTFSNFLSKATGIPQATLVKSITAHVLQLKGQLDAFQAGAFGKSYTLTREAYEHMGMTGDALAGAIAKKFPGKFS